VYGNDDLESGLSPCPFGKGPQRLLEADARAAYPIQTYPKLGRRDLEALWFQITVIYILEHSSTVVVPLFTVTLSSRYSRLAPSTAL
jgi:hypothetical protein